MPSIREKEKLMRRYSAHFRKGFISTYFLSILLYCTSFLTILLWNDQSRLQTVMNMKENDTYYHQEVSVMSDIRCRLRNGKIQEGTSITGEGYSYDLDLQEKRMYAEIRTNHPETLDILYDPEKKELTDMNSIRPYQKD